MRVGRDRGLWGCEYSIQYTTFTRTVKSETGAGKNVLVVVRAFVGPLP